MHHITVIRKRQAGGRTYSLYALVRIWYAAPVNMPRAKKKTQKKKIVKGTHRHPDAVLTHELLDFLAFVAHQLRTPVTVAKGYAAMLLEGLFGQATPSQKKIYEQIYASCERVVRLINNFLDLPRIHAGTMRFSLKPESLAEITRQAINESQPMAGLKSVALIADTSAQKFPVQADYENLLQAFSNVIDNALKYTHAGSVRISIEDLPSVYRIVVVDTGIGMAKEDLSGVFEKFSRVGDMRELYREGRGLGLYIARKIIEGHGGRIWAESQGLGKGSVFTIELPK